MSSELKARDKVFCIDGGAGRVLTSIPAFKKYAKKYINYVFTCQKYVTFPNVSHKRQITEIISFHEVLETFR